MKKISKGAFIAAMALISYANYASAQAVSFDSPGKNSGDLGSMVEEMKAENRLNIGHIAGEILHNFPAPQPPERTSINPSYERGMSNWDI